MSKRNKEKYTKYRADRSCWEVIGYTRGKRQRYATGFSRREDAEEKLAEIIMQQRAPSTNEQNITLGQIITYYVKEHIPTIARPQTALSCLERVIPFWGEKKLSDIRKSETLKYVEYRKQEFKSWQELYSFKSKRELSLPTVRRELEQLQAAVNYAHKDNLISVRPYIWKPDRPNSRTRWMTRKEVALLLRAARSRPRARNYLPLFILLGVYTGARSEALLTLRWHQVDFENGLIDFSHGKSKGKAGAKIPMPKRLRRFLCSARKYSNDIGYVINNNGRRVKSVKNSFGACCEASGLENVTAHTMRHTTASWLIQDGVSPSMVAKYLGHTSTQMIERVYGHLEPEHLSDVMEALK